MVGVILPSGQGGHRARQGQRGTGNRTTPDDGALPADPLVSGDGWQAWLAANCRGRADASPGGVGAPAQPGERPRTGIAVPDVWARLTWLARRHGFAVRQDAGDGEQARLSATDWGGHLIRISHRPDELAVLALLHELGHVLAHRSLAAVPGATTARCTGIRKVEADSIAFIAATRLGLDIPPRTWPSVTSWAGADPRAHPQATALAARERIIHAASTITSHLASVPEGLPSTTGAVMRKSSQPVPGRAAALGRAGFPQRAKGTSQQGGSAPGGAPRADGAEPTLEVLRGVLGEAERFYRTHLGDGWAPGYLRGRGVDPAQWPRWGIGYAPAGWTVLTGHLRRLGYPDAVIEAAGLARRSSRGTLIDHFRDRVMLAVRTSDGVTAGFIGRARPDVPPTVPKYLNSPETPLYRKGGLLFGLSEARDLLAGGAKPVLVEGPFDAVAATIADPRRYAGMAPCGTVLTAAQAAALAGGTDLATVGVLAAFDGDPAGHRAIVRAYDLLLPHTLRSSAAAFPAGRDPAEVLQSDGPAALRELFERSEPLARVAIDAHIDRWGRQLDHLEGRLAAMRSAAALIARTIPSETVSMICGVTGGRALQTRGEDMRRVPNSELPDLARSLPVNVACQVVQIARRTGFDCSEVTVEVVNAAVEAGGQSKLTAAGHDVVASTKIGELVGTRPGPLARAGFPPWGKTMPTTSDTASSANPRPGSYTHGKRRGIGRLSIHEPTPTLAKGGAGTHGLRFAEQRLTSSCAVHAHFQPYRL
jgi:DNA primase